MPKSIYGITICTIDDRCYAVPCISENEARDHLAQLLSEPFVQFGDNSDGFIVFTKHIASIMIGDIIQHSNNTIEDDYFDDDDDNIVKE